MQNNQWVSKYVVEFNAVVAKTSFGDATLLHQFYQGLAPWLKDVFSHNDHYTILQQCIEITYHIDQLYWEKRERQEHDQKPSSSGKASSGKGSDNQQTGQTTTSSSNTQSHSQQSNQPNQQNTTKTPNHPNTTSNKTSSSNTGSSSLTTLPKPYANLLGSDGKLKPEEKERRKHLGLCLVCGGNHTTDKCPNRRSAQGRSSQAKPLATSEAKTTANSVSNLTPKEQGK